MSAPRKARGVPLLSLAVLLGGWVAVRAAVWESPFPHDLAEPLSLLASEQSAPPVAVLPQAQLQSVQALPEIGQSDTRQAETGHAETGHAETGLAETRQADPATPVWIDRPLREQVQRTNYYEPVVQQQQPAPGPVNRGGMRANAMIAHAMLLAAGYDMGSRPSDTAPFQRGVGPVVPGVASAPEALPGQPGTERRWTFDLWALWRDDTTTPLTSGRPSYGRSQVGAVLSYRLAPASGHAPRAYLRATRALEGQQETDVAAGLSARPFARVPVRLAAEARVSETDRGTELRGAAYAVTELPPVNLPGGMTGEAYVQGGYVSGEFATPFVDGQARITRQLAGTDDFRLTAGAAAWGGAQEDGERLDVGPTAGVSFRLGQARGRVSADYRFRVAGDAEPASGPALTLTAGF